MSSWLRRRRQRSADSRSFSLGGFTPAQASTSRRVGCRGPTNFGLVRMEAAWRRRAARAVIHVTPPATFRHESTVGLLDHKPMEVQYQAIVFEAADPAAHYSRSEKIVLPGTYNAVEAWKAVYAALEGVGGQKLVGGTISRCVPAN